MGYWILQLYWVINVTLIKEDKGDAVERANTYLNTIKSYLM